MKPGKGLVSLGCELYHESCGIPPSAGDRGQVHRCHAAPANFLPNHMMLAEGSVESGPEGRRVRERCHFGLTVWWQASADAGGATFW
jgi:hypothetical protein